MRKREIGQIHNDAPKTASLKQQVGGFENLFELVTAHPEESF